MTVLQVRRHPVKSLEGEPLDSCRVDPRGLRGDRTWAVYNPDGKLGSGKSSRRFRRMDGLRDLVAAYDEDVPVLTFPDGRVMRGDDDAVHEALSQHVGRPVRLQAETGVPHHDDGPVHLVTTATLRALENVTGEPVDPRRLRGNLLVDWPGTGFVEDEWVGERLRIGAKLVVEVRMPMPRCVMVTSPTRDLAPASGLLRTITEVNDGNAGVLLDVVEPGTVRVGDRVQRLGLVW